MGDSRGENVSNEDHPNIVVYNTGEPIHTRSTSRDTILVLYFSSFCSDDKNNNKKRRRDRKEREREKKEREREQTEGKVNKQLGHLGEPRVMACVPEVWHL